MKFVLISDTHERHERLILPEGDCLIHAGDYTMQGGKDAKTAFKKWFVAQPHRYKILIAGNHDFNEPKHSELLADNQDSYAVYLFDDGIEIGGYKIWGSPYTPWFGPWAFPYDRPTDRWSMIPTDTRILVTHGPPFRILDRPFGTEPPVGCEDLRRRVDAVKPKLHVFGHIHGSYGIWWNPEDKDSTIFVNASSLNEKYNTDNKPLNAPLVIDIAPVIIDP